MTCGKRTPLLSSLLILSLFSLPSCSGAPPSVSAKTYRMPAAVGPSPQKVQPNRTETIRQMSDVRANGVFTEKNGPPEYIVGPGDILTIHYWVPSREEGFRQTVYAAAVRPDGKISFTFADDIPVSGHTVGEIKTTLTGLARRYLREPRIEVAVQEFRSKAVLLSGQINTFPHRQEVSGPGRYPLVGKTRVLDMITAAGGAITGKEAGNADLRRVGLIRQGNRYALDLSSALSRGDVSDNVVLDDGDMIIVPEMPACGERVYAFGQVVSPGVLPLRDSPDLSTAIALAGGTTLAADKTDIKIIRGYRESPGNPRILSVNLDQSAQPGGSARNMPLQAGDIVYVPGSESGNLAELIVAITAALDFTADCRSPRTRDLPAQQPW